MSTHVDKVYFQDPSIEWGYHMCQNRRVLLAWNYDIAVLSYVSLKPGCRTLLSHHSRRKEKEGEHIYKYFHLLFFVFVKQVIAQKFK